jgi:hypothetical protein
MSQIEDHLLYGEDMWFSKKCREAGIDLWIYPNVNTGHYGVKGWTGNFHEFLKGQAKEQDHSFTQKIS